MSTAYRSQDGSSTEPGERTVGQLFAAATTDLSALVHDEIALAKQEIKKDVQRGLMGGVAGAGVAVFLVASIPLFSFAAAFGIHDLGRSSGITLGWSILFVAMIYVLLAIVAGLLAFRWFKKISPPDRTIASSKATVDVLKTAKPHPAPTMKQM
jgi:Putative Actinobacterial Holin-X, holin superfamily III